MDYVTEYLIRSNFASRQSYGIVDSNQYTSEE